MGWRKSVGIVLYFVILVLFLLNALAVMGDNGGVGAPGLFIVDG
jgi:hypothetical protein